MAARSMRVEPVLGHLLNAQVFRGWEDGGYEKDSRRIAVEVTVIHNARHFDAYSLAF
jgi:hypothetical protein